MIAAFWAAGEKADIFGEMAKEALLQNPSLSSRSKIRSWVRMTEITEGRHG